MNTYNSNMAVAKDGYSPNSYDQQNFVYQQFANPTPESSINVKLQDEELWDQFSNAKTEMIVTKGGRRMFPGYRIKLEALNPNAQYCVLMDVVSVDQHRYKFQQGEWVVAGRGEPQVPQRFYLHPNSPCSGAKWMKDIVTFHKVKLTNSCGSLSNEKFFVHSMHQYQTRIHVVRTDDVSSLHLQPMSTFEFPQTKFITVTAYQNVKITQLKIENNPFARGFRKGGKKSTKRGDTYRRSISSKRQIAQESTFANKIIRQQPISYRNDSTGFALESPQQDLGYYHHPNTTTCNNFYQSHPTYEFTSPQSYHSTNTIQGFPCYQYQQSRSGYFQSTDTPISHYSSTDHQSNYSSDGLKFQSPMGSTDNGYFSITGFNNADNSNNTFCELLPATYSLVAGF